MRKILFASVALATISIVSPAAAQQCGIYQPNVCGPQAEWWKLANYQTKMAGLYGNLSVAPIAGQPVGYRPNIPQIVGMFNGFGRPHPQHPPGYGYAHPMPPRPPVVTTTTTTTRTIIRANYWRRVNGVCVEGACP